MIILCNNIEVIICAPTNFLYEIQTIPMSIFIILDTKAYRTKLIVHTHYFMDSINIISKT